MQSIHFLQPENQEGNILDLNNLQPVSEYQKQVVFDIVENGNKVDLDFLKNLNGFNFRNFNEFIQEDIDLVEYIIGRELLKSDFENSEFGGNQEKDLVYNLFVNICGRKRKVGLFFKDYLKNNLKLLYGTLSEENKVSNFFFEIGFEYKLEIIDGIKVLFGDSFSEKDIDTTLICTFYKLFNSFGKKDGIKKIAELFKGEITIENLKLYRNQFKNILSRFIGSFYDTTGESEIYDNIFYLRDVLGIDLKYSDFEKFYNSGLDIFFSLTHHNNKKINIFTIVEIFKDRVNHISEIFNSVDTIKYLYELENNYFFGNLKVLNNYFSLGKFSEFSTDFENGKYAFLLNYEGDLDKKLIDFLQEKGFLNSFEDFENLVNKRLFQNINFYIFKENFEYLEKQFGFKIEIENLSEYIILFLKYGNINNLEFIYSETLKLGFNISLYNFLSFLHFEGIEYRHYLSFISQPGLSEKIQYFYDKKGEEFNIKYYFDIVHNYSDIDNLDDNSYEKFDKILEDKKNKNKNIEKFKKTLDLILQKYPELNLEDKDFFNFIENISDNLFLLNYFEDDLKNSENIIILNNFINKIHMTSEMFQKMFQFKNIDFKLIQNENFISFLKNVSFKTIIDSLGIYSSKEKLEKIFEDNIDIEDLEELINLFGKSENDLSTLEESFFNRLNKKYKNFEKLIEKYNDTFFKLETFLFNVKSSGTKIFNEILELMKQEPDKDLYYIMNKRVEEEYNNFIGEKFEKYNEEEIKQNQKRILKYQEQFFNESDVRNGEYLEINENELEFSVYLRYGHTVDSPEVAEYIILFLEKYFKESNSKYFKKIRLLPRYENGFPNDKFFKGKNIEKLNIEGGMFDVALHKNAVAMFLSHSSYSNPYKTPQVISGSMKNNDLDVRLSFDLERQHCNEYVDYVAIKKLSDIFREVIHNIQMLEEMLDEIS